jgi:hypothetical protein
MRGTAFWMGASRWSAGIKPGGLIGKRRSGKVDSKEITDHPEGAKL